MNTKNLDAFIAVAELSSFTKAASSLGISQPTVTARIKRLEQTFKARLLQRSANGTRLTPAGHRLHRYARRIIQLAEVAQQTVTDIDAVQASLAVGAAEDLAAYRLVPLIEYLYLRYSDLTVTFQSMDEDPWTLVRERRIDCALFIGLCRELNTQTAVDRQRCAGNG